MKKNLTITSASDWLRGQDLNLRPSGYEHSELRAQKLGFPTFPMGMSGSYWKNSPITGKKNYHITTTQAFLDAFGFGIHRYRILRFVSFQLFDQIKLPETLGNLTYSWNDLQGKNLQSIGSMIKSHVLPICTFLYTYHIYVIARFSSRLRSHIYAHIPHICNLNTYATLTRLLPNHPSRCKRDMRRCIARIRCVPNERHHLKTTQSITRIAHLPAPVQINQFADVGKLVRALFKHHFREVTKMVAAINCPILHQFTAGGYYARSDSL